MRIILCGANPAVRLVDEADGTTVTAFASVWQVDWSERGAGRAIVLWHSGAVRVLTDNPELGAWLEGGFTRHFPEAEGLPWASPTPEPATVSYDVDLAHGLQASAGDVHIAMSGVLDRRAFATDEFPLDGVPHGLRLVVMPMARAQITVAGRPMPGVIARGGTDERPQSSAFIATAEVWLR